MATSSVLPSSNTKTDEMDFKVDIYLSDYAPDSTVTYPHLFVNVSDESSASSTFLAYKWRKLNESARQQELNIMQIYLDEIGTEPGKKLSIAPKPFSFGGFGDIFKGMTETGREVIVKKPKCSLSGKILTEVIAATYFEAALTSVLTHKNVIDLINIIPQPRSPPWLVYWYYKNGSLARFLRLEEDEDEEPITDERKLSLTLDIAEGMEYLRANLCCHRDLNPRNILITDDERGIIGDFGLATFLDGDGTGYNMIRENDYKLGDNFRRMAYTLYYVAPEVLIKYYQKFTYEETVKKNGLNIRTLLKDNSYTKMEKDYLEVVAHIIENWSDDEEGSSHEESTKDLGTCGFKSDVWSFGVVTHQIWTSAKHNPYSNTGYQHKFDVEDIKRLIENMNKDNRNPCKFVPLKKEYEKIDSILQNIFQVETTTRPSFSDIVVNLKNIQF